MKSNTDINILSNIPNFILLDNFIGNKVTNHISEGMYQGISEIKSHKSVKRFGSAIRKSLISFKNDDLKKIFDHLYLNESISNDLLILLFWNLSNNNFLFFYLNQNVFFPDLYSGRISIKSIDVKACIKDLQSKQKEISIWPPNTVLKMSSAYIRLLAKFGLMSGKLTKNYQTPYLNDKMFILFVYWIVAVESKPNLLESKWMQYSFCERPAFIERVLHKKYSKYYEAVFTGNNLNIETLIPYENIYNACYK